MILTSIPSWATPPESHPGSLKSHPQSQLIPLRFDWILMLCASYSPLYINLSILFISGILPLLPYLNRKESSEHRTHICDHTPHITIWQLQSPHSILITSWCILLTLLIPLGFSQHLACIHIWHSPFAALPQSERIFCASYSHLWPHTAYTVN